MVRVCAFLFAALVAPSALAITIPTNVVFTNGFEGAIFTLDLSGWNDYHIDPGNRLGLSTVLVREGTYALAAYCLPGGGASKAELHRDGLHVGRGQTTRLEWSVYVDTAPGFGPLYLADIEDTSYPKSPGLRVYTEPDDSLAVELKGYGLTLKQPLTHRVKLPTRRWVDLAWTFVPDPSAGWVRLEQDGVILLDGPLQTLPTVGDGVLDRLGIGCTANGGLRADMLIVDRVRLLQ